MTETLSSSGQFPNPTLSTKSTPEFYTRRNSSQPSQAEYLVSHRCNTKNEFDVLIFDHRESCSRDGTSAADVSKKCKTALCVDQLAELMLAITSGLTRRDHCCRRHCPASSALSGTQPSFLKHSLQGQLGFLCWPRTTALAALGEAMSFSIHDHGNLSISSSRSAT